MLNYFINKKDGADSFTILATKRNADIKHLKRFGYEHASFDECVRMLIDEKLPCPISVENMKDAIAEEVRKANAKLNEERHYRWEYREIGNTLKMMVYALNAIEESDKFYAILVENFRFEFGYYTDAEWIVIL